MPSSYTPNLGIELPADGELDGVWGDVTNDNMGIIDRAINGSVSLSLTGTSSTLTTSDGVLSDGQFKVLVLAGTPSGTHTITISPDDAQKIYFVRNTTAQSVVLTQGSGGNVTIATGDSAVIYSDGAGAGAAVFNITNDFAMNSVKITGGSITGITDLAVADGGTGASDAATARTNLGAQATITGAATTITTSDLTASRALASDGSGKVAVSAVTATELGHVSGVTSAIQTQLNNKFTQRTITGTADQITVTNGDGVSGNPTISLAAAALSVGQVAFFARNTAPTGWLKANGAVISRSTYAALFAAIGTTFGAGDGSTTFNIPDMRGEFPRGWDDGRGADSGRVFGSAQGDAIRNITGNFSAGKLVSGSGAFQVDSTTQSGDGSQLTGGNFSFSAARVVPTAAENRPRNIALLACIKF